MTMTYDLCVIGGGIIGLSTAWHFQQAFPQASIVMVEKEKTLARHQSGHNSGVIHAGVYYPPMSLKARFCREGARRTMAFCEQHELPYEQCGKLIVATCPEEISGLASIEERARANGLAVERLDTAELGRREPNIRGLAALSVAASGITDYGTICRQLASLLIEGGATISLNTPVTGLHEGVDAVTVVTAEGELRTRHLVSCGGLQADRLASFVGLDPGFCMVPFRGDYFRLRPELDGLVRHLIYPVPNPELPFLGIHLTPMIGGYITVGPNAALSLAREGYDRRDLNVRDTAAMAGAAGFWKLLWKHRGAAANELLTSFSKRSYLERCRKYCPDLKLDDLLPHPSGIRAQPVRSNGSQISDFVVLQTSRTTHVCNAPSPAATTALPIGEHVVALVRTAISC